MSRPSKAEQAEKELAREARKAEHEQARRAHDKARERYKALTEAELSDLLDERDPAQEPRHHRRTHTERLGVKDNS